MQNTEVGTDFTTDKLVGVPTATDIWAVLGQAVGRAHERGFDVGGSHKSQQTGLRGFGIRNQNRVLNDGVDTTEGTGGAGFYADYFAERRESRSAAAGGDVEMNAPGSAVRQHDQERRQHGQDAEQPHLPAGIVGRRTTRSATRRRPRAATPASRTSSSGKGHTDIGGPIMKDRAVVSSVPITTSRSTSMISGVPRDVATDLGLFDNVHDEGNLQGVAEGHARLLHAVGPEAKPNRGLSVTVSPEARAAAGFDLVGVQGRAPARLVEPPVHRREVQRVRLRLPARRQGRLRDAAAADRHQHQLHHRRGMGRVRLSRGRSRRSRAQSHLLRARQDGQPRSGRSASSTARHQQIRSTAARGRSGIAICAARPSEIQFVDVGKNSDLGSTWTGGNNRNQRYAGYAQDRWNLNNRTTLQLGLRWDYQRPLPGRRRAIRSSRTFCRLGRQRVAHRPADVRGQNVPLRRPSSRRNSIAPRLGVSYDVSGKGTTVLKGSTAATTTTTPTPSAR